MQTMQMQDGTQQQQPSQGARIASVIMNQPGFPAELKTEQWFHLLTKLHDHEDPAEVADFAASFMWELEQNGAAFPEPLNQIYQQDPRTLFNNLMSSLPVSQNKEYTAKFIDALVANIEELRANAAEEGDEDEETEEASDVEDESEVVDTTPAQAENAEPARVSTIPFSAIGGSFGKQMAFAGR
jgi:hypothetical protein